MRRAFESCDWVLETRHRQAWPRDDGPPLDGLGYALLREDWLSGRETPVPWPTPTSESSERTTDGLPGD